MSDVMMRLGDYGFGLDTAAYQELKREHSWRWAKVARVGRSPAHQPIGPDSTTIRMTGIIYPHWKSGTGQIERLRAIANKMEPVHLVDGNGQNWGRYVIKRLTEGQSHLTGRGNPRKQTFDLELAEYGEDAGADAAAVQ